MAAMRLRAMYKLIKDIVQESGVIYDLVPETKMDNDF